MTPAVEAPAQAPGRPLLARVIRIGMEDSDASRHIFYGAVQRWHSTLLSNWLASIGHGILEGLERGSETCPVVASEAQYLKPLWLDEEVLLALYPAKVGRASFALTMHGYRVNDGSLAVSSTMTQVFVVNSERSLRSIPLPESLREAMALGALPSEARDE